MNRPAPKDKASQIILAQKALAAGDLATTETICKSLIEAAPQEAAAWALLTETALLRNRPDAAKVCAERAVALAPRDPIARIMQAKSCLANGQMLAALKAAEAAAPLVGAAAGAADSLAAMFGLLGRHRQALEFSRRAVATDPHIPQYVFNLAATQRMLGALDEAEAHCDQVIDRTPLYALAYYLRSDLRIQSPARNHVDEMEDLLQRGGLDWRSETTLRYALAKECEDLGAHDRAFAHVAAGAAQWRLHQTYDARVELAEIDQIIKTQDAPWLASIAKKSPVVDAPVFVAGLPRTGTTLVDRIAGSHSAVVSVGETGLFAMAAAQAPGQNPGATSFAGLGRNYIDTVKGVFEPQKPRFLDKTLRNYLYCGLIHAALPKAKIILVLRDPMDTAWALYKAHFNGDFLFSYDLAELADYVVAYRRLVDHWRKTLPAEALMTVAYEDIVRDLPGQSAEIMDFLGLPMEEAALRFHESTTPSATASAVQVRRPLYATSVEKWRVHAEALAPFRLRMLRGQAISNLPEAGAPF